MAFDDKAILFYDGECGLCTRSVRFLMRHDRRGILYLAPLQGDTAKALLPEELRTTLSTVVYRRTVVVEEMTLLLRSEAALLAVIDSGTRLRFLAHALRLLPVRLRDRIYACIAENRLKIFPKGACALPTSDERERLLP